MQKLIRNLWRNNKSFLLFIMLMLVFRSAVADWNAVPTGSMKPTIIEGDRILVNKLAYDLRVPFTGMPLFEFSAPARGDIIVFRSEAAGKRLVKRVIGLPGDVVALQNNVLSINGEPLDYRELDSTSITLDKVEDLLGVEHVVRISPQGSRVSSFKPVEVPVDHYLALGDNRDNSADSRVLGFVPRNEILGRSRSVVMSLDYDNFYLPRGDRFFHTL